MIHLMLSNVSFIENSIEIERSDLINMSIIDKISFLLFLFLFKR